MLQKLAARASVLISIAALAGCELVFSFSPLAFLARDPADLPAATRVAYAENALIMGDRETMARAYAAMTELCAEAPSNPEYALVTGELAAELSGVPSVIDALLRGEIRIFEEGALTEIESRLETVDTDLIVAAAHYYQTALQGEGQLTSSHYIVGAFGLLVEACLTAGGIEHLDDPDSWNADAQAQAETAGDFLAGARDLYEEGNPALVFIDGFVRFFEQFYPTASIS